MPTVPATSKPLDTAIPHAPMRTLLHDRFRARSMPILAGDGWAIPAASIWAGARLWTKRFREIGLRAGDRVVIASPPGQGLIMPLIACWWDGIAAALVDAPGEDGNLPTCLLEGIDASLIVAPGGEGENVLGHDAAGCPLDQAVAMRTAEHREPEHQDPTALLLRTSGTSGPSRWVALSHANVLSQLRSHTPALGLRDATVLSVLPWRHAFGLLVDALPALLSEATVLVDLPSARDPERTIRVVRENDVTHLSMVPLHVRRLLHTPGGIEMLRSLEGGVVGGAPIDDEIADALRDTRLRVGYGQTEASPGITLGEPGAMSPGLVGMPLGCQTRVDDDGQLLVRGPNVCAGFAGPRGVARLDQTRWLETGDIVDTADGGYRFVGRLDASFKLPNGRMIHAAKAESALRVVLPVGVEPVVLPMRDGIEVVLVCNRANASMPDATSIVRETLGPRAGLLLRVRTIEDNEHTRTPKGEIDRRALQERESIR